MDKPSRYFVPYEDQRLWQSELARVRRLYPDATAPEELTEPTNYWRDRDFNNLRSARAFAREVGTEVYERVGIAPDPDAPGMWDYNEKLVV